MTDRRSFLKGSAALAASTAFVLPFTVPAAAAAGNGALALTYLKIEPSGSVTVICPVAELGQGTSTALAMILADALDAEWSSVRFELSPVAPEYRNPSYNMQLTGASTGISGFHEPFRNAGATARAMLINAAARQWRVKSEQCRTQAGRVLLKDGSKSLSYGQLASAASKEPVPAPAAGAQPASARFVGKTPPRLDIPSKVNGTAQYAIDVRLPDMLYAAVVAAPVFGSTLVACNRGKALARRGVRAVVDIPNGAAVVADRWWIAHNALDDLAPEWERTAFDTITDETISAQLWNDLKAKQGDLAKAVGEPTEALAKAETVLSQRYEVPFLAHTTMEPMSCVARVTDTGCEIWVGSQQPDLARSVAAKHLDLPESAVTVHQVFAGGGFGRRQEYDFVLQAVIVAKAMKGKPVKLLWSREEDVQHDYYRPAGVSEMSAALSQGSVTALRHRQASPSVLPRAFPKVAAMVPYDITVSDAIYPLYAFPNQDAWWVRSDTHVPTGMWRSVGAGQTIFAIESFMDELAHHLRQDAFAFRRQRLMHDKRALAALDRLGELCGWADAARQGRALGLALSHKNEDCLAAQAAEVAFENGKLRVRKIWTVAEPGRVIAPDIARAQIEGAAIWALTAALYGKVTISQGRVQESNFDTYEMVRLSETPEFETEFLQSDGRIEGVGEGGAPGVAPAVCNALFRLTGKRLRRLPIIPQLT